MKTFKKTQLKHADRAGIVESNDTSGTVEAEHQRLGECHTNSRVGDECSHTGSTGH